MVHDYTPSPATKCPTLENHLFSISISPTSDPSPNLSESLTEKESVNPALDQSTAISSTNVPISSISNIQKQNRIGELISSLTPSWTKKISTRTDVGKPYYHNNVTGESYWLEEIQDLTSSDLSRQKAPSINSTDSSPAISQPNAGALSKMHHQIFSKLRAKLNHGNSDAGVSDGGGS